MALQVWLPLNGNLNSLGVSYINATAEGATVNANGKIGQCYSFNGSNNYISLNNPTILYNIFKGGPNPFSIAFWIYRADSTRAIIFGDYGLANSISFNIELTTAHRVRFYWSANPDKNFTTTVDVNAWTHIILTYDCTKINIYKNGILQSDTFTGTLTTKNKTAGNFYLGRDNRTGTTAFNGRLNDFRVYNHCLSAAEARELAQGLVLHYKLDKISTDESTIIDSSGYGYDGIINSSLATSADTAYYNHSISFDGVDDCIIVPYNTICPENIFTINLWFKKTALGSKSYETLFGGPSGFEMDTRSGSSSTISLYMASTRSGNRNAVTSMSLNNWYMITMTRDGTKEKYYINGIYQSEIDAKTMPTGTYYIGAWQTATKQNYYGLISDFRIYCTPLAVEDILQLYNTSAKVDNKQNIHAREFVEDNSSIQITKQGQLKCAEINELITAQFKQNNNINAAEFIEY